MIKDPDLEIICSLRSPRDFDADNVLAQAYEHHTHRWHSPEASALVPTHSRSNQKVFGPLSFRRQAYANSFARGHTVRYRQDHYDRRGRIEALRRRALHR